MSSSESRTEATVEEVPHDYIKEEILVTFYRLQGGWGDVFVLFTIASALALLWKKRYRAAVGCLVLTIGVVFLRVVVFVMFGDLRP